MKISQQIFPRPVALIVTTNKKGEVNVMTASFLMPISFEPKYVAFSISPNRHSFGNLKEVPEFTMNLLSREMKKNAEICGSYSGKEQDKFKEANLITENSKIVLPPVIKCPISFECRAVKMEAYGDHFLVVGEVLNERIREEKFEPLLHYSGDVFMTPKNLRDADEI